MVSGSCVWKKTILIHASRGAEHYRLFKVVFLDWRSRPTYMDVFWDPSGTEMYFNWSGWTAGKQQVNSGQSNVDEECLLTGRLYGIQLSGSLQMAIEIDEKRGAASSKLGIKRSTWDGAISGVWVLASHPSPRSMARCKARLQSFHVIKSSLEPEGWSRMMGIAEKMVPLGNRTDDL